MKLDKADARAAPTTSRPKRPRRTQEEIRDRLLGAARAEFRAKGYAGATTAAISRRADVAEIQMFRYYPSKAELFEEAVFAPLKEHFRSFNEKHAPNAVDPPSIDARARLYMAELLALLNDNAEILASLFAADAQRGSAATRSDAGEEDLQSLFDHMAAVMATRAKRSQKIDPGTVVRVAFGSILGCITYRRWLFPAERGDSQEIERAITDFVLAGIAPHSDLSGSDSRDVSR